jgi:sulfate/thiosulfate-binding protein
VVTLALAYDIDALVTHGVCWSRDWQKHLPDNSAPYTSTIVFLVKQGQPEALKDWDDLVKPGVSDRHAQSEDLGRRPLELPGGVGVRQASSTAAIRRPRNSSATCIRTCRCWTRARAARPPAFVQRGVGDVLIAWENEAFLSLKEFGPEKFEIVVPSISILAEPSVAVVDKVVDKHGTRAVAEEYLKYLYSDEGQDIAGRNFYRPTSEKAKAKYDKQFPKLTLVTIDGAFGGWAKADKAHFADGGSFDQIYAPKQK